MLLGPLLTVCLPCRYLVIRYSTNASCILLTSFLPHLGTFLPRTNFDIHSEVSMVGEALPSKPVLLCFLVYFCHVTTYHDGGESVQLLSSHILVSPSARESGKDWHDRILVN
jgi:hypothetical protein